MNQQKIDEIKARCDKATPGPWISPLDEKSYDHNEIVTKSRDTVVGVGWYDGPLLQVTQPDASFISHSREDVPELLAEVERLTVVGIGYTKVVSELKENLDRLNDENAKLKSRLEISPFGDDKIDELEQSIEFLRNNLKNAEEKQTAKTPISEPHLWPDGRDYILHTCPKCHEEVSSDEKYCSECGQKLLWEK
jgi:hypothetical protein